MAEPTLRRFVDSLIPLLIGMVIGFLASMASFSSRISTAETKITNLEQRVDRQEQINTDIRNTLNDIRVALAGKSK